MKTITTPILAAFCASGLFAGCSTAPESATDTATPISYAVKVHEFEGCECNSVCPCVFSSDTTFGDCRATVVFTFNGHYGATQLTDEPCVVVCTWSGENMEGNFGKLKGVLYTADDATPAEREAIAGLLHTMFGNAFGTMESRTASIDIKRQDDMHELTLGTVAQLRIHGVRGKNGEVTEITNAPSPLAYPSMFCALSDVNKYDDGESSWSFTGRNGFYADFELASAK